jgi:hypothetical protein
MTEFVYEESDDERGYVREEHRDFQRAGKKNLMKSEDL